ncbi:MAG: hypothetical protein ACWA6X_04170 [Bauldia sp.]
MKKHLLMGSAAAVALVTAAGAAQAADVMPIVVPVVTPAVVPPPGPVKVVQIETTIDTFTGAPVFVDTAGVVDVRTASGWGFQLLAANSLIFFGGSDAQATLGGRVYRAMGDATVGVFANASVSYLGAPPAFEGFTVGIDADYHTDTVDLYGAVAAFFDGGFDGLQSIFLANIERGNFRIEAASLVQTDPLVAFGGVQVGYAFGPVTPYGVLAVGLAPTFGALAGGGLAFEHDVGERLTLTADVLVLAGLGAAPPLVWRAEAGFEYTLGAGGDGPLTLGGKVTTGTGGGIGAEISIGLKFGGDRVTGTGNLLFADLPDWFL